MTVVRRRTRLAVAALSVALLPAPASAVDDTTPPVIDAITVQPSTPHAYETALFEVLAHDDASGVASLAWSFSDGRTATGTRVGRVFDTAGPTTATVTATDGAGNASTSSLTFEVYPAQVEPSYVEPTLSRVRLRPATISARGLTPGVQRRTRLSFRLADLYYSARIVIVVRGEGTRARRVIRDLGEGDHTVRLGARIDGSRLAPGRYRVLVRASNDYGSEQSTARLRIVR